MKLSRRSLLAWMLGLGLSGFSMQGQRQIPSQRLKEVVDKAAEQARLAVQHTLLGAFSLTLGDLKLHACHALRLILLWARGAPIMTPAAAIRAMALDS